MFDRYNIVSERDLKEPARKLETYLETMNEGAEVDPERAHFGHTEVSEMINVYAKLLH